MAQSRPTSHLQIRASAPPGGGSDLIRVFNRPGGGYDVGDVAVSPGIRSHALESIDPSGEPACTPRPELPNQMKPEPTAESRPIGHPLL
ncbi:MAG TPA: hypothetical protein VFQ38_21870 [Longimicrobiales bacterium]|nr:hypothetical protein [Longimicrobiales bacterium]